MPNPIGVTLLSHILLAFRFSLGFVFLLSAWAKMRSPRAFIQIVSEFKLLPIPIANGLAMVLVPLEAFLAIAFLIGWLTNFTLPLATTMLCLFFIAVAINLRRGRRIFCGCFGDAGEQISFRTLARLVLLLTIVLLLIVFTEVTGIHLLDLSQSTFDVSNFIYLTQIAFLAIFFILMANWLLSLPEIVFLFHQEHWGLFLPSNSSTQSRVKET